MNDIRKAFEEDYRVPESACWLEDLGAYADVEWRTAFIAYELGFKAGAESRQPEIDELTKWHDEEARNTFTLRMQNRQLKAEIGNYKAIMNNSEGGH